jgi:hypothetical protein
MKPTEVKFRGLIFLESVYPEWSPGSNGGAVVWEPLDKEASAIKEVFDPSDPDSLEFARDRMRKFILYCRPADETKRSGYGWNPTDPTNKPTGTIPDLDGPGSP